MHDQSPEGVDDAWVRHELARLPAPVLPEEVLARVMAAVQAEAATTGSAPSAASLPSPRRAGRRSDRRTWILAGAGIAAAGALVLGTAQPWRSAPGTSIAEAPRIDRQAPEAGAGYDAAAVAPVLRATGTAYTADAMAVQVERSMTTGAGAPTSRRPDAAAVAACLRGAVPPGPLVLIDLATYEGVPALVVTSSRASRWDVVVQAATCTADDPALLARATVEPAPRQE